MLQQGQNYQHFLYEETDLDENNTQENNDDYPS